MPDRTPPGPPSPEDRTPAQREADHASLARLSETLVPALMDKLAASGLGELEVHEGSWRIRLRRPPSVAPSPGRRADHPRSLLHTESRAGREGNPAGMAHGGGSHAAHGVGADERAEPRVVAGAEAGAGDPFASDDPPRSMATSPAVGIFRPEVAVGARVRAGDRVGVVDLLGIPQDVPSPMDGILVEVFPAAGEAVEYGEAIAAVEAEVPQAPVDATDPDAADTSDDGESSGVSGPAISDAAGIGAADGDRG